RGLSFAAELDGAVFRADEELLPLLHAPGEDLVRERRLDQPLDDLPHRPRTERRLPAALRDQVIDEARTAAKGDAPLVPEPARAVREQELRDAGHLVSRERREDQPLVEPPPQFRRKRRARDLQRTSSLRVLGRAR